MTKTKWTIEKLNELAIRNRGSCLSVEYWGLDRAHIWQCSFGHIWEAKASNIIYGNTWCPTCNQLFSINEELCRNILEKLFDKEFKKIRPEWLVNLDGNKLELDGYNEELELAFEYQGEQHFSPIRGVDEDKFKRIQEHDKIKEKICKERGITLIQLAGDFKNCGSFDAIVKVLLILWTRNPELIKLAVNKDKILNNLSEDIYGLKDNPTFNRLKKAVEDRAVEDRKAVLLTSVYTGSYKPIEIICAMEHKFTTTASRVLRGEWCRECYLQNENKIQIDKLALLNKGKKYRLGSKHTEESKKKMAGFKNRKHSQESREKIAKASKVHMAGARPVVIDDIEYPSVSEAAKQLKVVPGTIVYRIKSTSPKFKTYYYKDQNQKEIK